MPGMVAAATPLPVIGIPRALDTLDGMDSLLSIVQMPAGVPVATVSIGGAKNAGLLAVRILGAGDPALLDQMVQYQEKMRLEVEEKDRRLRRFAVRGVVVSLSTSVAALLDAYMSEVFPATRRTWHAGGCGGQRFGALCPGFWGCGVNKSR